MSMLAIAVLVAALPWPTPDAEVVAHDLPGTIAFGSLNGERAFGIGGLWCNLGDANAVWDGASPNHPVTANNLIRVENGVLEQLGGSWAWHHFCALQMATCGPCTPAGPGCPGALGIGCASSSTASSMGTQSNMSRRSEINASTGGLTWPFSGPTVTSLLDRRCRVALSDIDVPSHPTAAFAFESATIHPAGSDPSGRYAIRRVQPSSLASNPVFMGGTNEASTAIDFWKSLEPDVIVATLDVPGDGRIVVGGRVAPRQGGGWRYDYAIENINSHESAGAFAVPLPAGAGATELRFRAPLAHSGELTSNAPWSASVDGDEVRWWTDSFAKNPGANAVRWGTTYTFGFNSDRAPAAGQATLTLFRSGLEFAITLPSPAASDPDLSGDGVVDSEDLALLLGAWGTCRGVCPADLDLDGTVGSSDLAILLGAWTT